MAERKAIRLGSVVRTNVSTYSEKEGWAFVNYLDTGNITQDTISEIQRINVGTDKLPSRARRKVQIGNIIYSTVRPNQLHYGFIKSQPDNFLVSTGFAVIDVNEKEAVPEYIYYFLTHRDVTERLQAIAEQSTSAYPSIKPSDIEDLTIDLPPIEEQRKIVGLLKMLDDKIKQNTEINNNLEQQADTLYQAFFSPKSGTKGKIVTLDEFCSIFTGKKNANASVNGGKYKFFTCAPDALQIDSYIYDGNAIIVSGNGAYTGRTRFFKGICDFGNIGFGEVSVFTVNHIAHLTGVNEQRLSGLLFAFCNEPEGNGNCHTVKELSRKRNNTFDQIILNNALADFSLTAGLGGKSTISKHEANLSMRGKVMNHVLNPCVVGVAGGRKTILPTHIIGQLLLIPRMIVERRIGKNKVCFQRGVKVIRECVCLISAEVGVDTTNSHIDLCHLPGVGICFLTVNSNSCRAIGIYAV